MPKKIWNKPKTGYTAIVAGTSLDITQDYVTSGIPHARVQSSIKGALSCWVSHNYEAEDENCLLQIFYVCEGKVLWPVGEPQIGGPESRPDGR